MNLAAEIIIDEDTNKYRPMERYRWAFDDVYIGPRLQQLWKSSVSDKPDEWRDYLESSRVRQNVNMGRNN